MSHELTAEFYAEKAKRELNETELRKEQSLKKFREWLEKHPFISNVHADDIVLLSYLRTNKYNLNRVFESFEYIIVKYYAQEMKSLDKPLELFKNGYLKVFKKRDENGCRNILYDFAKLDIKKFTFEDVHCFAMIAAFTHLKEPETQIAGINIFFDMTNFTMDHLSLLLSNKTADFMKDLKILPHRIKKITFVGLSTLGEKFVEFLKQFLSDKLRKRIVIAKTCDYLTGDDDVEDIVAMFNETRRDFELMHQAVVDLEIMKKYPKYNAVESFRQLEID